MEYTENTVICNCKHVTLADIDNALQRSAHFSDVEKEFAEVQKLTSCSTSCRVSAGSSNQLMSLTAPQTRQMKCACGSVRKSNRSSPWYTPTESMVPSALNMARLR